MTFVHLVRTPGRPTHDPPSLSPPSPMCFTKMGVSLRLIPSFFSTRVRTSTHVHTYKHVRVHVYTHARSRTHTYTKTHPHVHTATDCFRTLVVPDIQRYSRVPSLWFPLLHHPSRSTDLSRNHTSNHYSCRSDTGPGTYVFTLQVRRGGTQDLQDHYSCLISSVLLTLPDLDTTHSPRTLSPPPTDLLPVSGCRSVPSSTDRSSPPPPSSLPCSPPPATESAHTPVSDAPLHSSVTGKSLSCKVPSHCGGVNQR